MSKPKPITKVEKLQEPEVNEMLRAQEEQHQRAIQIGEAAAQLKGNHHFQTLLSTIEELKGMIKEECTRPEHNLEILRWYQAEYAILDNILLRLSYEGQDPNEGASEPADNE